ncbi:MAG: hypothetical protein GX483_07975 [Actinomycetaceae bacterium]|nr:hypothetical protein [Actinomycetaceae bacterium]
MNNDYRQWIQTALDNAGPLPIPTKHVEQVTMPDGTLEFKQRYGVGQRMLLALLIVFGLVFVVTGFVLATRNVWAGIAVLAFSVPLLLGIIWAFVRIGKSYVLETRDFIEVQMYRKAVRIYFADVVKGYPWYWKGNRYILLMDHSGARVQVDTSAFQAPLTVRVAAVVLAYETKPHRMEKMIKNVEFMGKQTFPSDFVQYLYHINAQAQAANGNALQ